MHTTETLEASNTFRGSTFLELPPTLGVFVEVDNEGFTEVVKEVHIKIRWMKM
jgi:hypothetical protein